MADATVPEHPWIDQIIKLAESDLDAARGLLQRFLGAQDALFATTVTIASLVTGLAFSNDAPVFSLLGMPVVAVLAYLDAVMRVHQGRAAQRAWRIEELFHKYLRVLRERGVARPAAVADLRRAIDVYQFGIERAFERVRWNQLVAVPRRAPRWWLFPVVIAVLAACSWLSQPEPKSASQVCLTTPGGFVRLSKLPDRVSGTLSLIECPKTQTTPASSTKS